MQVEIVQAGALELAFFTVERLQPVVNITDVFPQLNLLPERFITLSTLHPLTDSVVVPHVSPQGSCVFLLSIALRTFEAQVRMESLLV